MISFAAPLLFCQQSFSPPPLSPALRLRRAMQEWRRVARRRRVLRRSEERVASRLRRASLLKSLRGWNQRASYLRFVPSLHFHPPLSCIDLRAMRCAGPCRAACLA